MIRSSLTRSVVPWATAAVLAGLIVGFVLGQVLAADDDGEVTDPVATSSTTSLTSTTSLPTSSSLATDVPGDATVSCVGPQLAATGLTFAAGIEGGGAGPLAAALGIDVFTKPFAFLNTSQSAHRAEVLELAGNGPIVFLARFPGPYQKELAQEVIELSPSSVVVVVPDEASPSQDIADEYPPGRSVVVGSNAEGEPAFSPAWALFVASVLEGANNCSQAGG